MPVSSEAFEGATVVIDSGVNTALTAAAEGATPGEVADLLVDSLLEDPRMGGLDKDAIIKGALTLVAVAVCQIAQDEMQMREMREAT